MKKLIVTGGVLGAVCVLTLILLPILLKQPATDSYEVIQARTAAQLQELKRSEESAEFWTHFTQLAGVIVTGLLLAVAWVFLKVYLDALRHRREMDQQTLYLEKLKLKRDWNLLEADPNGNYKQFLDRRTGDYTRIEPGNTPYPEQYQFYSGMQPQQLPNPRRQPPSPPTTVSRYGTPLATYSATPIEPQQLSAPDATRAGNNFPIADSEIPGNSESEANFSISESEISGNFQDFRPLLRRAKQEGRGKTEAIKAIVRPSGNDWKKWAEVWDTL